MFGYTKPLFPQGAEAEYELYHSYYCGLCQELAQIGRLPYRFLLSYELTFMAIFFSALDREEERLIDAACPLPNFPRPQGRQTRFTRLAAVLSPLLFAAKAQDDVADGQSLRARVAQKILAPHIESCSAAWPEAAAIIKSFPAAPPLADLPELSGELIGELFQLAARKLDLPEHIYWQELARAGYAPLIEASARIGQALGQWVTLLDAIDDYQSDLRHGRDNYLQTLTREELAQIPERLLALEAEIVRHAALLPYRRQSRLLRTLIMEAFANSRAKVLSQFLQRDDTMREIWLK